MKRNRLFIVVIIIMYEGFRMGKPNYKVIMKGENAYAAY